MLRHFLRAVAVLVAPAVLTAQSGQPSTGDADRPATRDYQQVLSFNPFLLPFGWFAGEYERAVSPAVTVGIGGAYVSDAAFDDDDDDSEDGRDTWVEGKVRYFPNERAPRGFSVGLTAGFHSARNDGFLFEAAEVRSDGAPTFGVTADYDWLLGRRRRFAVGIGLGFKRVLADASNSPLAQVYPDGRVQIGIAF
jgi:hypothetical protein